MRPSLSIPAAAGAAGAAAMAAAAGGAGGADPGFKQGPSEEPWRLSAVLPEATPTSSSTVALQETCLLSRCLGLMGGLLLLVLSSGLLVLTAAAVQLPGSTQMVGCC